MKVPINENLERERNEGYLHIIFYERLQFDACFMEEYLFLKQKQGNYNSMLNLKVRNIILNVRNNTRIWEDIFRKSKRDFHCV